VHEVHEAVVVVVVVRALGRVHGDLHSSIRGSKRSLLCLLSVLQAQAHTQIVATACSSRCAYTLGSCCLLKEHAGEP
jgi:hypothetical protein